MLSSEKNFNKPLGCPLWSMFEEGIYQKILTGSAQISQENANFVQVCRSPQPQSPGDWGRYPVAPLEKDAAGTHDKPLSLPFYL